MQAGAGAGAGRGACRLCLATPSRARLLPIFEDGTGELADRIRACVGVQVNPDDTLPRRLCLQCHHNVNNWHLFKQVAERSQLRLAAVRGGQLDRAVKIKSEPLTEEAYDDGVVIDGSYPDFEQNAQSSKIQPEGPPILASLGLAPRAEKNYSDREDEDLDDDDELGEPVQFPIVPHIPEVSVTVMRPTGETLHARQGIQQIASKNCLLCSREYRYSHNARRHELTSHGFDRYTNKINKSDEKPKNQLRLRPNPFNPKSRMMPNPVNPKMQLNSKQFGKMKPNKHFSQKHTSKNNLPYPLKIKTLTDLQTKRKEPQILKSLLTSRTKNKLPEPEIIQSGPESPETLISEPEIASFQVEAIITEPDAFIDEDALGNDDMRHEEEEQQSNLNTYDTVNMDSDHEIEIARQQDISNDLHNEQSQRENNEDSAHNNEDDNEDACESIVSDQDVRSDKNSMRSDTQAIIENGIKTPENDENEDAGDDHVGNDTEVDENVGDDTVADDNVGDDTTGDQDTIGGSDVNAGDGDNTGDINIGEENGENEEHTEEYDEEMVPPIAPIVEINEGPQCTEDLPEGEEDSAENITVEEPSLLEPSLLGPVPELDPNKQYLTKEQKEFIETHRDIIEQINTKKCLCCDRVHSRRKAVIQHLQKNGHIIPKHTCYNCVVTFGTIGALLSHMRANVCTNLWKVIYNEEGITDDLIMEAEFVKDQKIAIPQQVNLNKVQYKDILNSRSYACKLCPAKFQLKQLIMKHVLDIHEDGQSRVPLVCIHCGYRFKENRLWKKHIRNGECTVNIACDLCPEKFQNMLEFNDHALAIHAGSFDQTGDSPSKNVDGRPTDCPVCQKAHSNYHNLIKHLRMTHNEEKPHHCQNCDSKFEAITDLNQHIYLEHSDRSAMTKEEPDLSIVKQEEDSEEYHYSCTECNSIFETVDAWTDHQVAEHNQVAYNCDQCPKKFLRPSELTDHTKTHLRVKFYSCNVCSNSYSTPQKLSDHVQLSHPGAAVPATPDQFHCDMCVRSFKSRQAYSNHMRIHAKVPTTNRKPVDKPYVQQSSSGKRQYPLAPQPYVPFTSNANIPNAPYSCDICGKGFMHKKNIWKHKKVLHADIVGEKGDSEENTMQAHSTEGEEESHYGENGTGLSIPQFNSFNFANFANNDLKVENPAMPFSCEICFKKFPLRTSLWKHKRAKHGIINVSATQQQPVAAASESSSGGGARSSCTICKISFNDKKSYYRHRKNVHKSNVQMCKICGKPLNSTLELYEHLKAAHARELLGYNPNTPKTQEPQIFQSEENDEEQDEFPDPTGDYHARYPCNICGKQFVGMLALQNHQCLQDTSQQSTFNCEICHKSYTSIAALKSHRGWHLRSPDGKAAANNSGLWMPHHKVTHKVSKYEVLEPAPIARFPSAPSALTVTKRRLPPEVEVTIVNPIKKARSDDSGEEMLTQRPGSSLPDNRYCAICDKEFTKKAAYQRHMDEVHRPNSVFCPVCDKSFTRKSTLLVHMRKHYEGGEADEILPTTSHSQPEQNSEEMYPCDLCGAEYRSNKALKAHRARHHGEDDEDSEEEAASSAPPAAPGEFTCSQCGDGVATPRDLLAHRTMHATPTKFFCHICKVYFPRALDLSSHTRARHSDNEKVFFPCAMCDRFYMNKKSLQRHIETSH